MKAGESVRPVALALVLGALAGGCRPKPAPPTEAPPPPGRPNIGAVVPSAGRLEKAMELEQFAKLYLIDASAGKPPKDLAAMTDLRRDLPRVHQAIEEGRYVVLWGRDPARAPGGASGTVLAYEKDAPEKGGVVAFLDGSARNVTVEEFRAAAKSAR